MSKILGIDEVVTLQEKKSAHPWGKGTSKTHLPNSTPKTFYYKDQKRASNITSPPLTLFTN
jgi:hypothetical protein